jgi:hypothetical protein
MPRGLLFSTTLVCALPGVSQAQVEALSGEELFIDRLGCWNCHGMTGDGGAGPAIAKTELSLRTFAMYLRLPSGEMPRVSPRLASDSELATLYRWIDGVEVQRIPLPIEVSLAESGPAAVARKELTLTARVVGGGLDANPLDAEALRFRVTLKTLVPWVREKTPVANQLVEYQLAGHEDWLTLTTDEEGEVILRTDQGFGLTEVGASAPETVRLRTLLPAGRHVLVVEAITGSDPARSVVAGIGTLVLRGSEDPLDV